VPKEADKKKKSGGKSIELVEGFGFSG
jgi:ribosomal protein S1